MSQRIETVTYLCDLHLYEFLLAKFLVYDPTFTFPATPSMELGTIRLFSKILSNFGEQCFAMLFADRVIQSLAAHFFNSPKIIKEEVIGALGNVLSHVHFSLMVNRSAHADQVFFSCTN